MLRTPPLHYSSPQDHSSLDLARCASSPLDARPAGLLTSRAGTAVPASATTEQEFSSGLRGPHDEQPFENVVSGLEAGGLPDASDPSSAIGVIYGRRFRPAGSTAHEATPVLMLAA